MQGSLSRISDLHWVRCVNCHYTGEIYILLWEWNLDVLIFKLYFSYVVLRCYSSWSWRVIVWDSHAKILRLLYGGVNKRWHEIPVMISLSLNLVIFGYRAICLIQFLFCDQNKRKIIDKRLEDWLVYRLCMRLSEYSYQKTTDISNHLD